MKKLVIPVIVFITGLFFIALSVLTGQSEFGIFFIFPMVIGGGPYLFTGTVLIIISFILPFIISFREVKNHKQEERRETSYGGVVFIGPIPIIFGKDKSIASKMMYIGLLIAVLLLLVYLITMLI